MMAGQQEEKVMTMEEIRKSMAFATTAMNDTRMEGTPESYKTLAENFKAIAEQLLQMPVRHIIPASLSFSDRGRPGPS